MTIGRLYKIMDKTNDNIYIGSTTQTLSMRLKGHVNDYTKFLNGSTKFLSSFFVLENNFYCIELIEEIEFKNKKELLHKEGFYIRNLKCVNKNISDRT